MTGADLVVHHGNELHATGHHLVRSLRALGVRVTEVGSGHTGPRDRLPNGTPLLWIESGLASFPHPSDLESRVSAAWMIDTHRGLRWRGPLAGAFDHCFVAQIDAVQAIQDFGVPTSWLPLAAFGAGTAESVHERRRDVSFVGFVQAGTPRARILDRLAIDFDLHRNYGYVPPDEIPGWYGTSKVVVNVPLANDLNMRIFEAAAAGAFVVTGPMNGLDEVAPRGSVLVVDSDDPAEWSDAVRSALDLPGRQQAATKLQQSIALNHTYAQRAATVVETLQNLTPLPRRRRDRRRVLVNAAVERHSLRQAWRISEKPLARLRVLLPALMSEASRTAARRMSTLKDR